MEREMESLIDNKTWELIEPPTDQTLIDSKWVYKLKDNPAGDEAKIFKARLVVNDETFNLIILVLCVDDMFIWAKNQSDVDECKSKLKSAFKMNELRESKRILGMEINRDHEQKRLWLSQGKPDIAFAMGKVSRYMSNPWKVHWEAVKWIMKHLKSILDYGLLFDGLLDNAKSLFGYVDVDCGQDLDKRRSTTGYVFTLGGGSISWRSTLQKCVAQSITEAEYVAVAEASKEAIWLDRLIIEMGLKQGVVNLHWDSQSVLHLAANQVVDSRVKHIDIKYHFIKQAVYDKTIELVKINGKLNPADALTKVIPLESFRRHCATMQVVHGEHM
ncbi:hypothetical protein AXG93_1467s1030 [Marchantia polymorpha subsp. ruderalis]|uniref:Reverse transcriptase Ty1/copia-type domain-containing protein n=1 Tax=Marchantia polymorpha subsp. ruderalis TaxID=1480154 RepID=A0A176WLJ6_MARPO|nr:hypothetical protein AXG93_1467s1030 [Marchantia polymorpha subsp. ruderalis]